MDRMLVALMVRPCSRRLQLESAITYFLWLSDYLGAFHPFNLGPVPDFPRFTGATLLSLPGDIAGMTRKWQISGAQGFFLSWSLC